jgi:hypothetical protein
MWHAQIHDAYISVCLASTVALQFIAVDLCISALYGVQGMCNPSGTSCTLDVNNAALNSTGANDVLKVLWRCAW